MECFMPSFKNKLFTLGLFTTIAVGMFACGVKSTDPTPVKSDPDPVVVSPNEKDTLFINGLSIHAYLGGTNQLSDGKTIEFFSGFTGPLAGVPNNIYTVDQTRTSNIEVKFTFNGVDALTNPSGDRENFEGDFNIVATPVNAADKIKVNGKFYKVVKFTSNQLALARNTMPTTTIQDLVQWTKDVQANPDAFKSKLNNRKPDPVFADSF